VLVQERLHRRFNGVARGADRVLLPYPIAAPQSHKGILKLLASGGEARILERGKRRRDHKLVAAGVAMPLRLPVVCEPVLDAADLKDPVDFLEKRFVVVLDVVDCPVGVRVVLLAGQLDRNLERVEEERLWDTEQARGRVPIWIALGAGRLVCASLRKRSANGRDAASPNRSSTSSTTSRRVPHPCRRRSSRHTSCRLTPSVPAKLEKCQTNAFRNRRSYRGARWKLLP